MAWTTVAKAAEVSNGGIKTVMVGEKPIMVSQLEGRFYAVDAVCMHKFGYLPMGKIVGACITCPAHGAEFDLRDGKVLKGITPKVPNPALPVLPVPELRSYELIVENGEIKINV